MNSIVRLAAGAAAIASLALFAGCSPQKTFVAEVGGEEIPADDYYKRALTVDTIPQQLVGVTDAGGVAMLNMVSAALTDELARKRNVVPSEALVNAVVDYQMRTDPITSAQIAAGRRTRDDVVRENKYNLEAIAIGTDGEKPSEQDINKAVAEYKDNPEYKIHASYTVKYLPVPDDTIGRQVITMLKQTGDFGAAAQKFLGARASQVANLGKEQKLMADQIPAELRAALDKLQPNEITPEPVGFNQNPNQPLASTIVYVVAQLKSKEAERPLPASELRLLLVPVLLQKSHPDWKNHYRQRDPGVHPRYRGPLRSAAVRGSGKREDRRPVVQVARARLGGHADLGADDRAALLRRATERRSSLQLFFDRRASLRHIFRRAADRLAVNRQARDRRTAVWCVIEW